MRGMTSADTAKPGSVRLDWTLVTRLWPYMRSHKTAVLLSGGMYIFNAASVVLPPYILQQILDRAIPSGEPSLINRFSLLYLATVLLEYASGFCSEYIVSVLGQQAMSALRQDLFAHVQKLPISFFEHTPIGRLLTRLTSDVEAVSELFATGAITMISDLLSVVAVTSMMLYLSPKLTLAALLIVPVLLLIANSFQSYARRAFQSIRRHIARINAFMAEHLSAMALVQSFGQQERTQKEFWLLNEAYRDANRQAILADASLYAIVEAIGTAAVALCIAYGAKDLARGAITPGVLVAFILYIRRFFVPIRDLSTKYTVLQSAFAAAERVFALLDTPVNLLQAQNAKPVQQFSQSISLKQVYFSFREHHAAGPKSIDDGDWTLHNINLTIKKGERVGLVGATGSGKTTLLKLLNRSYDVQRGAVEIDGIDVRDLELRGLRELFAVVLQDPLMFSGTILQNLTLADRISRDAVERALDVVQARDLIDALPLGLDTPIKDLGGNFSAGERQVLALARAVALDPQILLMDEATSHIDSATEAHIQAALELLLTGRTAVIVAHRLSTVEKVDRIIVLRDGRIIQEGSHAQLMAQEGAYRTLVSESRSAS